MLDVLASSILPFLPCCVARIHQKIMTKGFATFYLSQKTAIAMLCSIFVHHYILKQYSENHIGFFSKVHGITLTMVISKNISPLNRPSFSALREHSFQHSRVVYLLFSPSCQVRYVGTTSQCYITTYLLAE